MRDRGNRGLEMSEQATQVAGRRVVAHGSAVLDEASEQGREKRFAGRSDAVRGGRDTDCRV